MLSRPGYSHLPTLDDDRDTEAVARSEVREIPAVHMDMAPVNKPPVTKRDAFFAALFLLQFAVVIVISAFGRSAPSSTGWIPSYAAPSWTTMMLVAALLGTLGGFVVSGGLAYPDTREAVISVALFTAIVLQICFGNALLLSSPPQVAIGFLFFVSAVVCCLWWKQAKDAAPFTCASIDMVLEVQRNYLSVFVVWVAVICVHLLFGMWWGATFVNLLESKSGGAGAIVLCILLFNLYWTSQVLHGVAAFVASGTMGWWFLRDAGNTDANLRIPAAEGGAQGRVWLYLRCALTSSFGTICQMALVTPICQLLLYCSMWSSSGRLPAWNWLKSVFQCALFYVHPLLATRTRLCLPLVACFGYAISKAGNTTAQLEQRMGIFDLQYEDTTSFVLHNLTLSVAGVIAFVLAIVAVEDEAQSWALLFIACFYLAYTCASIGSHPYRACTDTSILMYAVAPANFVTAYPIIYHRYLRQGEMQLYNYSPRGRSSKSDRSPEARPEKPSTDGRSPLSVVNTPSPMV